MGYGTAHILFTEGDEGGLEVVMLHVVVTWVHSVKVITERRG